MVIKNKIGYKINSLFLSLIIIIVTRAFSGIGGIVPMEPLIENDILIACMVIYYIYRITEISVNKDASIIANNKNIIFLVITLCGVSIYSDNIKTSLLNILILLGLFIIASTMLDKFTYRQFFDTLTITFSIIILFNIFFMYKYPNLAYDLNDLRVQGVWKGGFPTKNYSGMVMCLGTGISSLNLFYNKNCKVISAFNLLSCFILLIKSHSSTSLITLFAAVIIIIIIRRSRKRFNLVIVLLLVHAAIYLFTFLGQRYGNLFELIFNRDITLTGRTVIWQAELKLISQRLFFGYGYGVFWFNKNYQSLLNSLNTFPFIGSHNGFTALLMEVGAIGTLGVIFLLLDIGKKLKHLNDKTNLGIIFVYGYLSCFLLYIITEQSFSVKDFTTFFLLVSISVVNKQYHLKKINP
jgi:exopolysaccharide production protein ExoQ